MQLESILSYHENVARLQLPPSHPLYVWVQQQNEKNPISKPRLVKKQQAIRPERGPIIVQGYRHLYIKTGSHPLVKDGRVPEHRLVLWNKIGPGTHSCHWCSKPVTWFENLQCDHVDWDKLNNAPENLVPSCQPCNFTRHNPVRPPTRRLSHLSRAEIREALEAHSHRRKK